MLAPHPDPTQRKWVVMTKGRSARYRFQTETEARGFIDHLLSINAQIEYRVCTFDER
jgi:hypothetical protein